MKIALLIFHEGRNEYLERTLSSFVENVMPIPEHSLIVNDSYDKSGIEIAQNFGVKKAIHTGGGSGIFRAIEKAWQYARENWPDVEYVFHQENDFTYNEKIPVDQMLRVLQNEHVMQVALKRQAWYPNERKRGGFMEMNPKAYVNYNINGVDIVTHREFFTNNPSIYRLDNMPENYMNEYLIRKHFAAIDPKYTCTFLGKRQDAPKVTHIGEIKL
jgi:hypothetical protein